MSDTEFFERAESIPVDAKNLNCPEVKTIQTAIETALPFRRVRAGQKRTICIDSQMVINQTMFIDGGGELAIDGELVIL